MTKSTALRRGIILSLALIAQPRLTCAAPDPIALLRGVENAREEARSGRFEMTVKMTFPQQPKRGEKLTRLVVAFDGSNRRYDQFQRVVMIDASGPDHGVAKQKQIEALGGDPEAVVHAGIGTFKDVHVHSAYDGTQLMQYAEDMGSQVKDPSKGTPDFVFDPRLLGISVWLSLSDDLSDYLAYRDAKSFKLIGREDVAGHPTWHVNVIDHYGQDKHLWVADGEHFRVYRSSLVSPYKRLEVESIYDDLAVKSPLPLAVTARDYDSHGKLSRETRVTVDKAQYNVRVDPKSWTIAGLGMPLGQMVVDERIHRVVGHFDGEGLTPQLPDALRKAKARHWSSVMWLVVVAGGIIGSVLAAAIVQRRGLLRRGI